MSDPADSSATNYSANLVARSSEEVGRHKPSSITVIGVVALLGGILGLLATMYGTVHMMGDSVQLQRGAEPMSDADRGMLDELNRIGSSYKYLSVIRLAGGAALNTCLIVGSVALMRCVVWSPHFLRRLFAILIVFGVLQWSLETIIQWDMIRCVSSHLEKSDQKGVGISEQPNSVMMAMQNVMLKVGLVYSIVWMFGKTLLLLWGRSRLRSDHVLQYLSGAAALGR